MSLLLLSSIGMTMVACYLLVVLLPLPIEALNGIFMLPIIFVVIAPVSLLITASLGLTPTCIGTIHGLITACFKRDTTLNALLDIGAFCHLGWKCRSATNLSILKTN